MYYYLLLMTPIYEPLAFFGSIAFLIALGVRPSRARPACPPTCRPMPTRSGLSKRPPGEERPAQPARHGRPVSGTDQFGVGLPSAAVMCGLTVAFLAFWGFAALVAYSIAGEKMPWLKCRSPCPSAC